MAGKIFTDKISGMPDEMGWAQIYDFEDLKKAGKLLILIASSQASDSPIETAKTGRDIATFFKSNFEKYDQESIFSALKDSLRKTCGNYADNIEGFELAAVAVKNNFLYITLYNSNAYVFFDGKLRLIAESTSGEQVSASGIINKNKKVLLINKSFLHKIDIENVNNLLNEAESEKAEESFVDSMAAVVRGEKGFARSALLLIKEVEEGDAETDTLPIRKITEEGSEIKNPVYTFEEKTEPSYFSSNFDKINKPENPGSPPEETLSQNQKLGNLYLKADSTEGAISGLPKSKKTPIVIGIVLLLVLGVSIAYGINKKREKDFKQSYTEILNEAMHNVTEASDIYALDKEKSRYLFSDSLAKLDELKEKKVSDSELAELINAIESGRNKILGEYEANSELFLDTSLLSQGFKGNGLSFASKDIYVSDSESKKIVKVDIGSKRSEVVLGSGKADSIIDIASEQGDVYILLENGAYQVSSEEVERRTNEGDKDFRIHIFNSNLYVIDSASEKIWKYTAKVGGFSEPVLWTDNESDSDFSGFSDWTIDGYVWVLKSDGKILKLVQGEVIDFTFKEVVPALKSANALYADAETDYLYILDNADKRMVVYDKGNGDYIAQYTLDSIENPQSLVVSEGEKKAVLLDHIGRLYSVELKHLE